MAIARYVTTCTNWARPRFECIVDGGVAAATQTEGDGAFRPRESIQSLRLAGLSPNTQSAAEYEPMWELP